MRALDVGVIGCGTAGSAAAIFLAHAGHRVTIYERVPDPQPIGAGITIQPTGLHVLDRLGLLAEVVACGARIERLLCVTQGRRRLVDLSYASIGAELFGLGLHRGVLFEALTAEARRAGAEIECGVEIVAMERVAHAKAWTLRDTDGHMHGRHDFVIVADGARSRLRDASGTNKTVTPYPWGALWYVAKETRETGPADRVTTLHQVADGNARFVGLLPTGCAHPGGDRLVSLFWSLRADQVDAWKKRGLDPWKNEVRTLAPEAEPLLEQIHDPAQVLFATYNDVVMQRWATRSIVYLGDAAHATSPQLGQGCNLALWDAMTLADALDKEPSDLACALDAFCRARRDHLAFYQVATRWLTPFFQGDIAALGVLRDLTMPIMTGIPITNRIMTLSMLGVMDGFFGRRLI